MPNHCEQDFTISGDPDTIDQFVRRHIWDNSLDCNSVIPYPNRYKVNEDGFNQGGYEWCCDKWGTKWGTYDGALGTDTPRQRTYHFSSAWSPAIPVFDAVAALWPALTFKVRYFEQGMGYAGEIRYKNGQRTKEVYRNNYRGHRGG